jgi:class 3 adenylate cyclase/rhodanese-related sulfurtransferase
MTISRVTPNALHHRLQEPNPPLLLDARRSAAFARKPEGIGGALPIVLDADPQLPDIERTQPVVAYCLCSGQASSTRVALWLTDAGYRDVAVLDGGLPAWEAEGLPLAPIDPAYRGPVTAWRPVGVHRGSPRGSGHAANPEQLIAERAFLSGQMLPVRRDMAVLFVDMVDSTSLVFSRTPEAVLGLVQAFMEEVVRIAVNHCGDIHDFQGDGAMLYFAGVGEALPAAVELHVALARRRTEQPDLPPARMALDAGPLVIGYVGTAAWRSVSFIGPSVNTAARILKLAPPGGIAATERVIAEAARTDPDLAAGFTALPEKQSLKGVSLPVTVYVAPAQDTGVRPLDWTRDRLSPK